MLSSYEIIFKLLLGTLLGGIIGFERQTHGRPAGFRTQLLVCVSCVLIMIISESYYTQSALRPEFRMDPTRLAAGAMTGVGFLGAGVILKTGVSIQGLTTAACIWIVAAIGLAIGAGQYLAGISGFVIAVFSLWVLRIWESKMPRLIYKYITVITDESGDEERIQSLFKTKGFDIVKTDYHFDFVGKEREYKFTATAKDDVSLREVVNEAANLTCVRRLDIRG